MQGRAEAQSLPRPGRVTAARDFGLLGINPDDRYLTAGTCERRACQSRSEADLYPYEGLIGKLHIRND